MSWPLTIFAAGVAALMVIAGLAILRTERRSSGWVFFIGLKTETETQHHEHEQDRPLARPPVDDDPG